jgi:hypothetical protein
VSLKSTLWGSRQIPKKADGTDEVQNQSAGEFSLACEEVIFGGFFGLFFGGTEV